MLRITVEIVPFGVEERKREIASGSITNIGGDPNSGNYIFEFSDDKGGQFKGTLNGYPRLSARTVWEIIRRVLNKGLGERGGKSIGTSIESGEDS